MQGLERVAGACQPGAAGGTWVCTVLWQPLRSPELKEPILLPGFPRLQAEQLSLEQSPQMGTLPDQSHCVT